MYNKLKATINKYESEAELQSEETNIERAKEINREREKISEQQKLAIEQLEKFESNLNRKMSVNVHKVVLYIAEKQNLDFVIDSSHGYNIIEEDYHYNQLNFERKNNFEGWTCWAGRVHMKITPSGDVYVGSCHVGGKLGNVYELTDAFVLPEGPLTCPKWRCTDNLDIRVPKALPGYEHVVEPYVTKVSKGL